MENKVIVLDKPVGITSNQALGKFKRVFGVKKCGYVGTLDPLASGVLIVCCNKATKEIPKFLDLPKDYEFTIQFGIETESGDADSAILSEGGRIPLQDEIDYAISQYFLGKILQTPPVYSATKYKGDRLCDLKRKGFDTNELQSIAISKTKQIEIYSFTTKHNDLNGKVTFLVSCSKGTYIRQIAIDLGKKLDTFATVIYLRRLAVGSFRVEDAIVL